MYAFIFLDADLFFQAAYLL